MDDFAIELDAYVLPDDHMVFKLFPGQTYRLNKQILSGKFAFLDIQGLNALGNNPLDWTDDDIKGIIAEDRIAKSLKSKQQLKKPGAQDTRRLRYLRNLFFVAKQGDLVVVPLGKGLDGDVAIGEFAEAPGALERISVADGDGKLETWGRSINWLTVDKRKRFSQELNKSLHAPTAFHALESSFWENIYLAAYGSFTYDDIYVARFPSEKEHFTTADQANIGIWFNAVSVAHDRLARGAEIDASETFVELGLEESSVELELLRNSPLSVVIRSVGPLAFSAMVVYSAAAEGKPLSSLQNATVSARTVAGAPDKCKVEVPPDLAKIAKGLGLDRWTASCRLGQRVEKGATVKPNAHLKAAPKQPN